MKNKQPKKQVKRSFFKTVSKIKEQFIAASKINTLPVKNISPNNWCRLEHLTAKLAALHCELQFLLRDIERDCFEHKSHPQTESQQV